MKTLIVTLILSALSAANYEAEAKEFYKNVEIGATGKTITTSIYQGEKEMNLIPYSKQTLKLDENGNAQEKVIYVWNSEKHEWIETFKYQYYYNLSGDIDYLTYTNWNKSLNMWETDIQYTMYIYSMEGDLLTVNQ